MKIIDCSSLLVILGSATFGGAADFPFAPDPDSPARLVVDAQALPDGDIEIPTPFANITSARAGEARFAIEFNDDATALKLLAPTDTPRPATLLLDTAEESVQFPDGTIIFSALDGTVTGTNARLESHPGNHRIGFWNKIEDTVSWTYQPSRYGSYRAEVTYSLASGTSEIEITFGGTTLAGTLPSTGSWYRYRTVDLGTLYVPEAKTEMLVRPLATTGGAVMNLKAVTLRPASEGEPVVQNGGEAIELDSSQATIHGVKLRYEPNPEKHCLGYWTVPSDFASWDITFTTAGSYTIEITQGCGKGNGGSGVTARLGGQSLDFTVEDTGGFQNWKARALGQVEISRVGVHRLEIRPKNKTNAAVMDIRRVRLIP